MSEVLYDIPLDTSTIELQPPFVPKTAIFVNGSNVNITVTDEMGHTVTIGANDGGAIPVWPARHWRVVAAAGYTTGSAYIYFSDKRIPGSVGGLAAAAGGGGAGTDVTLHDHATVTQWLAIDANGRLGVNNFPASQAVTSVDGGLNTVGLQADTAYVSGSGTVISVLKGIFGRLANLVSLAFNAAGGLIVDSRGAANIASGQVATSTTAATLVAARATRQSVMIRNLDAAISVYIGPATVTTANGMLLKAGESLVSSTTALIQVIAASGTPTVAYFEEYS